MGIDIALVVLGRRRLVVADRFLVVGRRFGFDLGRSAQVGDLRRRVVRSRTLVVVDRQGGRILTF